VYAESQKECDEVHKEMEQCVSIKTEEKLSLKDDSCDSEISTEHKTVLNVVEEKAEEMNDLSQIITEKLKFLSEGRENVSAVQTMQIQLQVSIYFYMYYTHTHTHTHTHTRFIICFYYITLFFEAFDNRYKLC